MTSTRAPGTSDISSDGSDGSSDDVIAEHQLLPALNGPALVEKTVIEDDDPARYHGDGLAINDRLPTDALVRREVDQHGKH
jgi:hypothetical protein